MSSGFLRQFETIKPADLEWRDYGLQHRVPFSREFDDIYFNPTDGLAESEYVFLEGNHLPADWESPNQSKFCVAELGFGSGLNFLMTVSKWQETIQNRSDNKDCHLNFISIEKRPFTREDFLSACKHWPQFSELAEYFCERYPSLTYGRHQIEFPQWQTTLTLFLMPVEDALADWLDDHERQTSRQKVDHWFFDGFAPAKNESMWGDQLCQQVAKLSKPNTRLATFSVAGNVKNPLKSAGFELSKKKGFGRKREMLTATLSAPIASEVKAKFINLKYESPWLAQAPVPNQKPLKIAVIGAGLAGCTSANRLAAKGFDVTLFEQGNDIASGASGAAAGIYHPQLTADMNINSQFNWLAYLYLQRYLLSLDNNLKSKLFLSEGLVRLMPHVESKEKLLALSKKIGLDDWIQNESNSPSKRAIRFNGAAALSIPDYCRILVETALRAIDLKLNTAVKTVTPIDEKWEVKTENSSFTYDHVIFSGGAKCELMKSFLDCPTHTSRGQTMLINEHEIGFNAKDAICEKAYIVTQPNGDLLLGTTFEDFEDDALNRESQNTILRTASNLFKELESPLSIDDFNKLPLNGSVGYRLHANDRLPVIGPVIDKERLKTDFDNLGQKRIKRDSLSSYNIPGLWLNTAYGSHGLIYSLLGSEYLACEIASRTSPISASIVEALYPGRAMIQSLKKG